MTSLEHGAAPASTKQGPHPWEPSVDGGQRRHPGALTVHVGLPGAHGHWQLRLVGA